jgi:16S rRNA processing protein RimM
MADKLVAMAAVAAAHGIAGEVRLKLFGEGVVALKRYRAFVLSAGRVLNVTALKDDNKGGAVARFAEVLDRNAAEALRGQVLHVERSELPPLAEGEYYHADLIGLPAVSTTGEELGVCVAVDNYGAGDVLEIERPTGENGKLRRFMVPMTPAAVPEWSQLTGLVIDAAYAE